MGHTVKLVVHIEVNFASILLRPSRIEGHFIMWQIFHFVAAVTNLKPLHYMAESPFRYGRHKLNCAIFYGHHEIQCVNEALTRLWFHFVTAVTEEICDGQKDPYNDRPALFLVVVDIHFVLFMHVLHPPLVRNRHRQIPLHHSPHRPHRLAVREEGRVHLGGDLGPLLRRHHPAIHHQLGHRVAGRVRWQDSVHSTSGLD